jgi:hypothetical protein
MCEDYPCCGHEQGDCKGQRYGSDASIIAREMERLSSRNYDAYYDERDR